MAKKFCSLTSDEVNKFEAVRELNGITDLYDMINLTDNIHYYTLVKDMSDIKAVGKLHIMTRDGGISAEDINNIDFEAIGKKHHNANVKLIIQVSVLLIRRSLIA